MKVEDIVYKTVGEQIEIPAQLRELPGIRFILLHREPGKRKNPKESGFLKDKNYSSEDLKLEGWRRGGGNYGVLGGYGGLAILDADVVERLRELGVIERLPATFTTQTGSGGLHYYFFIAGLQKTIKIYDKELRDKETGDFLELGQVQSFGNFVVGPNCIHNNGKRYQVVVDAPIAELDYETLMDTLKVTQTHKKEKKEYNPSNNSLSELFSAVRIADIAMPLRGKPGNNGDIIGEHPIHGHLHREHAGKENFSINPGKNVWHCFSHGVGGGWVKWIAVQQGFISCADAEGKLDNATYRKVMEYAREKGLIEKWQTRENTQAPHKKAENSNEQKSNKIKTTIITELPITPPTAQVVMIEAPPREGKTHTTISWLWQAGGGNFFTHNHAIANHAFNIACEMKCKTIVRLEGMNQPGMCISQKKTGDCDNCRHKPDQHKEGNISHFKMEETAKKLLREKKALSKRNIPDGLCPYYVLKYAERFADYCITVIQNINDVRRRQLEVIDEDTAMKHFYPQSIELCTIRNTRGKWGGINNLTKLDNDFQEVLTEHKRKTLETATNKLKELCDIIENKDNGDANKKAELLRDCLKDWVPKKKYVREDGGRGEDDITLEKCVNCLENLYIDDPISVKKTGNGAYRIDLLADERYPTMNMDWWENRLNTEKVVIIGATIAKRFIEYVNGEVLEKTKFVGEDDFVLLVLDLKKTDDQKDKPRAMKNRLIDIAQELGKPHGETLAKFPVLVLTGSKQSQRKTKEKIKTAHESSIEGEEDQKWNYRCGIPNITYQNSTISRGLDVDVYNVVIAADVNFAQPFWSVVDSNVANKIVADETTNSVLRVSSTKRTASNKAKLIIISKEDLWKVRYLNARVMESTNTAHEIANVIMKLCVTGKTEMTNNGLEITQAGASKDKFYERIWTALQTASTLLSDQEERTLTASILGVLSVNKGKWVTTRDIRQSVEGTYDTIIGALQRLYYDKIVQHKKAGKSAYWMVEKKSGRRGGD